MSMLPIKVWLIALEVKSFRVKIIISGTFLVLCALAAPKRTTQTRRVKNFFITTWLAQK